MYNVGCPPAYEQYEFSKTTPDSGQVSPISFHGPSAPFNTASRGFARAHLATPDSELSRRPLLWTQPVELEVLQGSHNHASRSGKEQANHLRHSCRKWYNTLQDWRGEILTWVLATVSLFLILSLFARFHGRFVTDWKSRISINTIVSVLSQAAVSALLFMLAGCVGQMKWIWFEHEKCLEDVEAFDRASRGPEGSMRFLISRRRFWYAD